MTTTRRSLRRRRQSYRSPEGRKHPLAYTAAQLHRFLVADAVAHHATDLAWAAGAYAEIARQRRQSPDAAFSAVVAEVEAAGKAMPIATGPIR